MKIGFIGLGNMGAPMAVNLTAAGRSVTGFDINAACPPTLVPASSAIEAAKGCEVMITMLPDGAALHSVAMEVMPELQPGSVFLDCSTVDVASAVAAAEHATTYAVEFVDAPVSGGVVGAEKGTLTFMAGGSPGAFEKIQPLFGIMGARAVHCGVAGTGQVAKICNNMILGATMIATCEAFGLADRLGLDRQKMFDVVSSSSGYSWSMNVYCPAPSIGPESPSDHGYKPGFAADLMLKDLRLSQQAAAATGAATPMGALATEIYRAFVEEEQGTGVDFSGIIRKFTGQI
ncbi:MAG: 3-hydroxyisobutyrate dehydrogenase [Rhodobacteraceae bacterium]|nr:3-hydroxyisobutyrate dehydrogenase [Paracoccaceae bacterium]